MADATHVVVAGEVVFDSCKGTGGQVFVDGGGECGKDKAGEQGAEGVALAEPFWLVEGVVFAMVVLVPVCCVGCVQEVEKRDQWLGFGVGLKNFAAACA